MNISIRNPDNGRQTVYTMTQLAQEARNAVRQQFKGCRPRSYWVEFLEGTKPGHSARLCVDYLSPEGAVQSLSVVL